MFNLLVLALVLTNVKFKGFEVYREHERALENLDMFLVVLVSLPDVLASLP